MHELALAQGVIRLVEAEQKEKNFRSVSEISIGVGEYSGVIPECLEEFFPYAAKETAAEGAKLVFRVIPGRFLCRTCGGEGPVNRISASCEFCGSTDLKMTAGREFIVESLKVEE